MSTFRPPLKPIMTTPTAMPEAPLINISALLLERSDMDAGVVAQLRNALAESSTQYSNLKEAAETLENNLETGRGDPKMTQLKLGISSFFLGRMERAAEMLEEMQQPLARYYLGLALNELGQHESAITSLESAGAAGYAVSEVQLHKAAALRGMRRYDDALKTLQSLESYVHTTAEYAYQLGALLDAQGDEERAIEYYEKAIAADSRHVGALFQLAYRNDMAGNDEEAVSLYERCLQLPPARVGTLINLGILYEDQCRYEQAAFCYSQVLKVYPTHARARLFLRDASSSRSQFYDEDAERRNDRYSAVLDIPVTDFELSVRSRNCLEKMNIHRLGDLTRISEQQLLASKNFGETSLQEIKNMLSLKGLRLGQTLEQSASPTKRTHPGFNAEEYSPQEQVLFSKPISELNLSVRSRKCMNRLGIATIGELCSHTGDELLECKNFGVTSLTEVREKLTEIQLKLRGD